MKYLRISRHGKVRGGVLDDDEDEVDNEFKLSPSADEDEFAEARGGPRLPAAGAAAGRQVSATPESSWRLGGAARRKRLSLPAIRLYSSLDSPGACYGEQPLAPGAATQVTQYQAKNNGAPRIPNPYILPSQKYIYCKHLLLFSFLRNR